MGADLSKSIVGLIRSKNCDTKKRYDKGNEEIDDGCEEIHEDEKVSKDNDIDEVDDSHIEIRLGRETDDVEEIKVENIEHAIRILKREEEEEYEEGEEGYLFDGRLQQHQQSKKKVRMTNQATHERRIEHMIEKELNRELKEVTTNMNEVQDLFNDVKMLVDYHGDQIDTIEDTVDLTVIEMEKGRKHIEKARSRRPRNMVEKACGAYNNAKRAYKITSTAGRFVGMVL